MGGQRGIGAVGFILALVIAVFAVIVAIRLVPAYLEYFTIKRALVNTAQSPESKNATVPNLRKAFERRAEVDNIKAISASDVDITQEGGNPVLSANYSVKVPLFANVSACIDFSASSSLR
ncbi:MAG: DUF4845 domain-containing protein [Burkholderiales bacterium]|nr:DUF4845 domain-containing protein [Burkholderiales bacterium]